MKRRLLIGGFFGLAVAFPQVASAQSSGGDAAPIAYLTAIVIIVGLVIAGLVRELRDDPTHVDDGTDGGEVKH